MKLSDVYAAYYVCMCVLFDVGANGVLHLLCNDMCMFCLLHCVAYINVLARMVDYRCKIIIVLLCFG